MGEIKEKIKNIKESSKFKSISCIVEMLILIFLFSQMVLNLGYSGEALAQTHKDHFMGIALIYLLISLLLIQRVKLLNVNNILAAIILCIFAYMKLLTWEEMPDIYNVVKVRWGCIILASISIIDMIMFKKIAIVKERDLVATISFAVIALVAYLLSGGACYSHLLIFPIVCLFLLRIDKEKFDKWIFCLSLGYYISFVYTMIKSFVLVPYTGERYYGIYINHGLFGIFIGGAFICSLWWMIVLIKKKAPIWKKAVMSIFMIFPLLCSIFNGARVSEFAVLVVGFLAICIWGGKANKKNVLYRIAFVSILAVVLLILGFLLLYLLSTCDEAGIKEVIGNDVLCEKILYWNRKARQVFDGETRYGIIEGGTLLNAIDQFSSGRLSHWMIYLKETTMKPAIHWDIAVNGYILPHPHNIYIYWLYGMGLIPGILMNVWCVIYLARAVKKIAEGNERYLFTFLWLIYYLVVGINENPIWITPVGYIMLILYYPIMMKWDTENSIAEEEKING